MFIIYFLKYFLFLACLLSCKLSQKNLVKRTSTQHSDRTGCVQGNFWHLL
uniref:Uncharacterized protein n=1 Tax=Mus musculus TaxID=10090 RepID=Q3V3I9_MOUSE|nr:unnamed protein product [Mus musculus]